MDLIRVLKEDHEALRRLAREAASSADASARSKALRALARRFRAHAEAEEKIFYPWLARVPAYRTEGDAAAALHAALGARLAALAAGEAQGLASVIEDLERHLGFEEAMLFGALEGAIGEEQAQALGEQVRRYEEAAERMAGWQEGPETS